MRRMGLVNCALAPLEPKMWTPWNTPDEELFAKIGKAEVARAVPWSTLTPEQKDFQRTKMAIHAAMITRMDLEIGKVLDQLKAMDAERDTVVLFSATTARARAADSRRRTRSGAPQSAKSFRYRPRMGGCSNAPFHYKSGSTRASRRR